MQTTARSRAGEVDDTGENIMCVISAYYVHTAPTGFATCEWPATSHKRAHDLAKTLSQSKDGDLAYPNPFWVIGATGKALAKYFRGQRYQPSESI